MNDSVAGARDRAPFILNFEDDISRTLPPAVARLVRLL